jgi:hypothetical protein
LQELKKQRRPGDGVYDAVVSISSTNGHDVQMLGLLIALARPGASLFVQEPTVASQVISCVLPDPSDADETMIFLADSLHACMAAQLKDVRRICRDRNPQGSCLVEKVGAFLTDTCCAVALHRICRTKLS